MFKLETFLSVLTLMIPVVVWGASEWVGVERRVTANSLAVDGVGVRQELVEAHLQQQLTDIRASLHRLETKIDKLRIE